jgi:hypothetical protein
MTLTIELSIEQETALRDRAQALGVTEDPYARRLLEENLAGVDTRPIWEVIPELMSSVPDEVFESLPRDGASEHDHHLYGTPKRNR